MAAITKTTKVKEILTILILLIAIKVTAQNNVTFKTDSSFYLYSVDSIVKYILTKEKPALINLLADKPVLNMFPNIVQGLEVIKLKKIKKLKAQNNSFYIYVGKLGGTATIDKRGVFLRVLKCINDDWSFWEGYGGYNFDFALDSSQKGFVLKKVTTSIMLR